mmetsp:Transcript_32931/g.65613  ORF Transcript_32931/g.65613 Transcript_32931/m.65613 type:complete len:417 (-) Transcript_32931:571-1821(-)
MSRSSCMSRIEFTANVLSRFCGSTTLIALAHFWAPPGTPSRSFTNRPRGPTGLCSKRDSLAIICKIWGAFWPNWVAGASWVDRSCCSSRWALRHSLSCAWLALSACLSALLATAAACWAGSIFSLTSRTSASALSACAFAFSSFAAHRLSSSPDAPLEDASACASEICLVKRFRSCSNSFARRLATPISRSTSFSGFVSSAASRLMRSTLFCASSFSPLRRSISASPSSGVCLLSRSAVAFASAASRSTSFFNARSCFSSPSSRARCFASASCQNMKQRILLTSSSILSTRCSSLRSSSAFSASCAKLFKRVWASLHWLTMVSSSFFVSWIFCTTRSRSVAFAKNLYFSFSLPLMNSLEFSWSMMHTGLSTCTFRLSRSSSRSFFLFDTIFSCSLRMRYPFFPCASNLRSMVMRLP